jgi:nickel/cobalt exporter
MSDVEKLGMLLPHWIEHNGEHAEEFRAWAERVGVVRESLAAAAELLQEANERLRQAMERLKQGPA